MQFISLRPIAPLLIAFSLGGCATSFDDSRAIRAADEAVAVGDYDRATAKLEPYLKRNWWGKLRIKWFTVYGVERESLIESTSVLLWETGRDTTLLDFSNAYLSSREAEIYRCRVLERRTDFHDAYQCWEDLGERQRARRVQRTEALLQFKAELNEAP